MESTPSKIRQAALRFGGFSLVGATTTLAGIALLFVLNELLRWNAYFAYVFTYALSILLSYYLNGRLVFQRRLGPLGLVLYYLAYISGMMLGLVILYAYNFLLPGWNRTLLSVCVIPVTTVWNYVLVSLVMHRTTR